jgi:hypothetical protein
MSVTDLDEARRAAGVGDGDPWPPADGNGSSSVAERAANGGGLGEEQGEMFPLGTLDGDPKRTLASLIRKGVPLEYTASLMSAEVPLQGGLLDVESSGQVLVTWEPAKVEIVPVRKKDGSGKLDRAKVRQKLRPTYVQAGEGVYTREQVLEILNKVGVPESAEIVAELLGGGSIA